MSSITSSNQPRHSILTMFDPLNSPMTPRRNLTSPDARSEKENLTPQHSESSPMSTTVFFQRTYSRSKVEKVTLPRAPRGLLVDLDEATIDLGQCMDRKEGYEQEEIKEEVMPEEGEPLSDIVTDESHCDSSEESCFRSTDSSQSAIVLPKDDGPSSLKQPNLCTSSSLDAADSITASENSINSSMRTVTSSVESSLSPAISSSDSPSSSAPSSPFACSPTITISTFKDKPCTQSPLAPSISRSPSTAFLLPSSTSSLSAKAPLSVTANKFDSLSMASSYTSPSNAGDSSLVSREPVSSTEGHSSSGRRLSVDLDGSFLVQQAQLDTSFDLINDEMSFLAKMEDESFLDLSRLRGSAMSGPFSGSRLKEKKGWKTGSSQTSIDGADEVRTPPATPGSTEQSTPTTPRKESTFSFSHRTIKKSDFKRPSTSELNIVQSESDRGISRHHANNDPDGLVVASSRLQTIVTTATSNGSSSSAPLTVAHDQYEKRKTEPLYSKKSKTNAAGGKPPVFVSSETIPAADVQSEKSDLKEVQRPPIGKMHSILGPATRTVEDMKSYSMMPSSIDGDKPSLGTTSIIAKRAANTTSAIAPRSKLQPPASRRTSISIETKGVPQRPLILGKYAQNTIRTEQEGSNPPPRFALSASVLGRASERRDEGASGPTTGGARRVALSKSVLSTTRTTTGASSTHAQGSSDLVATRPSILSRSTSSTSLLGSRSTSTKPSSTIPRHSSTSFATTRLPAPGGKTYGTTARRVRQAGTESILSSSMIGDWRE